MTHDRHHQLHVHPRGHEQHQNHEKNDLLAKSHNHTERIAELCQSLCDLFVHGERSAPNCFHEEKSLRPDKDFSYQDVDHDHDKDKDKHCLISDVDLDYDKD